MSKDVETCNIEKTFKTIYNVLDKIREVDRMKKINVILICILIALVFTIIGFIIGKALYGGFKRENALVGTYKTNQWNGKEAVIALQKDKTMICPNGIGTWSLEEGKLYIEHDYTDENARIMDEFSEDLEARGKSQYSYNYIKHTKEEVLILEGGLLYKSIFFERVDK